MRTVGMRVWMVAGKKFQRVRNDIDHRPETLQGATWRSRGIDHERGVDRAADPA